MVVRKITSDTELAGRQVRATEDEPQYLVRSEKGGGEAVHKPDALKRQVGGIGRPQRHGGQRRLGRGRFSTSFCDLGVSISGRGRS